MSRYGVELGNVLLPEGDIEYMHMPSSYTTESLRLTDQDLKDTLRLLDPGKFVLDERKFEDVSSVQAKGTVYETLGFEYGRHKNSHGLIFGQLVMSSLFDYQKQEFVAIKPFDTPKDAIHEFAVNNYINGFGKAGRPILALNTLGFYRHNDTGQYGLVTEYDESIISYDNLFWNPDRSPTVNEVDKALARCALALARLHMFGLSHGDAQVKNMASDNVGVRFIDLESARPFPRSTSGIVNPSAARHEALRDISTFVSSLTTGSEEAREPSDELRDKLLVVFQEQYIEVIKHPSSRFPEEARPDSDEIRDTIAFAM